MSSIRLFRDDLEGLRGLAVSLVVLFHAGLISGGFVGVDVFFVLSGFFMADVISREIDAGSFRFSQFYARRIRRILPALVAVLLVTSVFAWLLFMPEELESFSKGHL